MKLHARAAAAAIALCLVAAACTGDGGGSTAPLVSTAPTTPSPDVKPSSAPTGPGSAAAAAAALCDTPTPTVSPAPAQAGPVPDFVTGIEAILERVRGLTFEHPVPVEPQTKEQLDAQLRGFFESSIAPDQLQRRGRAWQTIGVIPVGTDLQKAYEGFLEGQVVGFYVPENGELVVLGSAQPSALEKLTVAHELTHALDDQHFNLTRTDRFGEHCQDERQMASLGAVEGSAQFFSIAVGAELARQGSLGDLGSLNAGATTPPGVPPFVMNLELWPYTAGLAFISARDTAGGTKAVNVVIKHLPVSTEQVIHPERYPNDLPQPLDIPDLGPALGTGWTDLDVMDVGEAWLSTMLDLRLDAGRAAAAAAGWDGGIYRAWSNGSGTAVLLRTVWDTPADATEFATAMQAWIGAGKAVVRVEDATHVSVGFASDAASLTALQAAAG